MTTFFSAQGISKRFGDRVVLQDVGFDVAEGEVHGIMTQLATDCSRYCTDLVGRNVRDGSGYSKRADTPILRGSTTHLYSEKTIFIVPEWSSMRHLSALDALFLQLETPDTLMHVGSLMRMAAPRGVTGRRTAYDQIRRHMEARLHLAPIFSRRLAFMPLDLANPIWVDARVDLDYHIKRCMGPCVASVCSREEYASRVQDLKLFMHGHSRYS